MSTDQLAGLEVFVAAAEAGSFAVAGQRLHLSRSAVGKTIARLEQRLGTRLFQRTTRQQSLTADGQAFYERCVRAIAEVEAGVASLSAGRHQPVGRLRISAPISFGRLCVAPIVGDLVERYPELEVELELSNRLVDLVNERYDLVVRTAPLSNAATLSARRLAQQDMWVAAAPSYLNARGRPASIGDLSGHEAILYGHLQDTWTLHELRSGEAREASVRCRLRLDDVDAIAEAAAAGRGLALLPNWLIDPELRAGRLERVLAQHRAGAIGIYAMWPSTKLIPSKTRIAIDALVEGVPRLMGLGGRT
ncbi:MAG: LysR substrate-binding domain-containing protein [Myxococcota bacterium]